MSFLNSVVLLFAAAGAYGTALMLGTLGEILTEKSGNLNLGVEGIMYMGGIFGLIAPNIYETAVGEMNASPFIAILLAILASFAVGAAAGALFSFITVTLRANQNVTGLAMTTFGTGVAKFAGELRRLKLGGYVTLSNRLKFAFDKHFMPEFLKKIPVIGKILFDQSEFFYLAIILAVLMHLFLTTVQLSHPYMTTGKTIALTRWTFVGKVMSLLFKMLSKRSTSRLYIVTLLI